MGRLEELQEKLLKSRGKTGYAARVAAIEEEIARIQNPPQAKPKKKGKTK